MTPVTAVDEGSVTGSGRLADMLEKHVEKDVLFPEERLSSALTLLLESLETASLPQFGWRVNLDHEVVEGLAKILLPSLPAMLEEKSINLDMGAKAFVNAKEDNPLALHADTPPEADWSSGRQEKTQVRLVVTFPSLSREIEKDVLFLDCGICNVGDVLRFSSYQYSATSFARGCNSKERKGHETLKHGVEHCPPGVGFCLDFTLVDDDDLAITDVDILKLVTDAAQMGSSNAKLVSCFPMPQSLVKKTVRSFLQRQSQLFDEVGISFFFFFCLCLPLTDFFFPLFVSLGRGRETSAGKEC